MGATAKHPPYMPGHTVQIVNFQTGVIATGTTVIPNDNTIPQNDEGDEYMTLAFTPKSSTNKLKIEVIFLGTGGVNTHLIVALFQDAIANALAVSVGFVGGAESPIGIPLPHFMVAGTTSEIIFKIRAGLVAANILTFNGAHTGIAKFGGVLASSITITEYKA